MIWCNCSGLAINRGSQPTASLQHCCTTIKTIWKVLNPVIHDIILPHEFHRQPKTLFNPSEFQQYEFHRQPMMYPTLNPYDVTTNKSSQCFTKNMGRKVIMFKTRNIIKKITKNNFTHNNHSHEHTSELVQFTIHNTWDRQRKRRTKTNIHLNKYYPHAGIWLILNQ
jgi:hypothetical protein